MPFDPTPHGRRTFLKACAAAVSVAPAVADPGRAGRIRFGPTDLYVSRICEGTAFRVNRRGPDDPGAQAVLRRCLDVGINFFDSSNAYGWGGAELALGKAIAGRRHEVVLCTKVHPWRKPQGSEPAVRVRFTMEFARREIQGSLARLGTDRVDLYLLHNPDPESTLTEVADIMIELVQAGYTRYWGVSNHSPAQVRELVALGNGRKPAFRIAAIENRYSIVRRALEAKMFAVLRETRLGALLFSPLDEGKLLAADPAAGDPRRAAVVAALDATARRLGATRAQVLIAWVLAHPEATCALAGAETPQHIDENIGGIGLRLPEDALASLDAASRPFLDVQ